MNKILQALYKYLRTLVAYALNYYRCSKAVAVNILWIGITYSHLKKDPPSFCIQKKNVRTPFAMVYSQILWTYNQRFCDIWRWNNSIILSEDTRRGGLYHFLECLCQVSAIIKQVKRAYFESQTANDLDMDNASKYIFIFILDSSGRYRKYTMAWWYLPVHRCIMLCMMFIVQQHIHFCTRIIFNG